MTVEEFKGQLKTPNKFTPKEKTKSAINRADLAREILPNDALNHHELDHELDHELEHVSDPKPKAQSTSKDTRQPNNLQKKSQLLRIPD